MSLQSSKKNTLDFSNVASFDWKSARLLKMATFSKILCEGFTNVTLLLKKADQDHSEGFLLISSSENNKSSGKLVKYVYQVNPFVPSTLFFYPLKTSENLTVFWCFQGIRKRCIGNEWVNLEEAEEKLIFKTQFSRVPNLFTESSSTT